MMATFLPPRQNAEGASSSGTGHLSSSRTFRCIFPSSITARYRHRITRKRQSSGPYGTGAAAPRAGVEAALRNAAGRARASARPGGADIPRARSGAARRPLPLVLGGRKGEAAERKAAGGTDPAALPRPEENPAPALRAPTSPPPPGRAGPSPRRPSASRGRPAPPPLTHP